MLDEAALGAYLNDHRAGATAGVELLRRLAEADGEAVGAGAFEDLRAEVETDLDALEKLMTTLGIEHDPARSAAGWLAEKASRLRLSETITGSAALTHLLEVEGIMLGVRGKRALWEALQQVMGEDPRLADVDLVDLVARARAQEETLDARRQALAEAALAGA